MQFLSKGKEGDGLLLAAAGLIRLNYLQTKEENGVLHFDPPLSYRKLSLREMIPAPGQSAIGIEVRSDDGEIHERLRSVNHFFTWAAVTAERAFLRRLGGGCATPVGAYAKVGFEGLKLSAFVAQNKDQVWRGEKTGKGHDAENLGKTLAEEYLQNRL